MKNTNEQAFKEITQSLTRLQKVQPDAAFRERMERKVHALTPHRFAVPVIAFRTAMAFMVLLFIGGTGVIASADSKPGTLFYPVKKMVEDVKTTFIPSVSILTTEPTPLPRKQQTKPDPTLTPAPEVNTTQEETPQNTYESTQNETIVEPTSTPTLTPTLTPTPTPVEQTTLPAVDKPVDQVLNNDPVQVDLPIGGVDISQPTLTPTPTPNNEGSKDNGSNAGAGGSLLPKLKKVLQK